MKLALLGSTGHVGKAVLQQALNSGHQVKVLVRTPGKLTGLRERIEVIQGDLQDQHAVQSALHGCEAVISAAGGVKEPNQHEVFRQSTEILLQSMNKLGIKRLVSINGAATVFPGESVSLKRKMIGLMIGLMAGHMKVAKAAEIAVLLRHREIDWVSVRAFMIVDKPAVGTVLADDKEMPGSAVALPDLARFMLDQTTENRWVHKSPFIASA